jgi:hypothetical protein
MTAEPQEQPMAIFADAYKAKPNGKWPSGTWLQKRLAQLKAQEIQELMKKVK